METLKVLHIFHEDFPGFEDGWCPLAFENRILEWCFTQGADEFTYHSSQGHPIQQLMKEPDFNLTKHRDQVLEIARQAMAEPLLHLPLEVPSELRPFYVGRKDRAVFHPYHATTSCQSAHTYALTRESLALLTTKGWYSDMIFYRRGLLMYGVVDHENEGILALRESEVPQFEELGIPWRERGQWVDYRELGPK